MEPFQFKKLELKNDDNWLQRQIKSPHVRRTVFATLGGALLGLVIYYFTEGQAKEFTLNDATNGMLTGAFFGFFITNSPCARGRC